MNMTMKYFILSLFMLSYAYVLGQSEDRNSTQQFKHPLSDMPGPSEDVVTSYFFPQHPDQKLPIGDTVSMLCHFANDGKTSLNVTAVMASLNSPYDFNFYVQNLTYKPLGVVVKGGEEITLEYQFQVHPMLEPVDFTLSSTVFYESEEMLYSNTFFNQTVELYLPMSDWDLITIIQVVLAIFSTGLVGAMVFYGCLSDKPLPINLFGTKKKGTITDYFEEDSEHTTRSNTKGRKGKSRTE